MKAFSRNLYLSLFGKVSQPKKGVYILNGHYLTRKHNAKAELFITFLNECRQFAEFINIEDAVQLIESGEAADVDGTFIAFTFDDGFDDCYHSLAPSLDKFGVNACFFVNPNYIDGDAEYIQRFNNQLVKTNNKKPLSWKEVKSLHDSGFIIGNHTLDHLRLSELDKNNIEKQIILAKEILESKLTSPCEFFAWPYGQYSDICDLSLEVATSTHKYAFSGCNFRSYTSCINGRKYFNRRHFEASWPPSHLKYFLSKSREYN
ncbi:polysaccharide deacetylase family protein [Pseudoalteromonas sp. SCSIO 43101]|uniref:polysaccharide deacetylase family protein n=1 Tax=Pseudoalteromonas sp. SCSIO 43101 TaxID=2822847 RepID=UPI00202B2217|nr:polysaccharide deacetylase family protein [Pseudoalteromonas sp. SCSIO 43101]URQ90141.1 polysaccharide deacetylase family protein [Pseudoalteromonas sp. SCSIO 43101]